jgi:hypothetical protein
MRATGLRKPPVVVSVPLGPRYGLADAERSCKLIESAAASLHDVAKLAAARAVNGDEAVCVDWCQVESLLDVIRSEMFEGPFSDLRAALCKAIRETDATQAISADGVA